MEIVQEQRQGIDLGLLDRYARVLDSSIRLPGTKRTIGIDPILGMIPILGDAIGYIFSALVLVKAAQHGASTRLILKILLNTALDATIGAIPVLGTLFDFVYKANERNVKLLREYHDYEMHRESTLPIFIGIALFLFLIFSVSCYLIYQLLAYLF